MYRPRSTVNLFVNLEKLCVCTYVYDFKHETASLAYNILELVSSFEKKM